MTYINLICVFLHFLFIFFPFQQKSSKVLLILSIYNFSPLILSWTFTNQAFIFNTSLQLPILRWSVTSHSHNINPMTSNLAFTFSDLSCSKHCLLGYHTPLGLCLLLSQHFFYFKFFYFLSSLYSSPPGVSLSLLPLTLLVILPCLVDFNSISMPVTLKFVSLAPISL